METNVYESKIFSNSIFNLKNRLYYSKNLTENIHRETNIFTPIFILNAISKLEVIETEDKNLFNIQYKWETINEVDIKYDNYKTRIKSLYKEIKLFFEKFSKYVTEETSLELYNFLRDNKLYKEGKFITENDFIELFKRLYKLLLSINYNLIKNNKIDEAKMKETFSSILDNGIINQSKKFENLHKEGNTIINLKFLRDEIYKRFMFNKLNLIFYNILIDLQLLSIDEIKYSGYDEKNKINVINVLNEELEKMVKAVFFDSIIEIDINVFKIIREVEKLENIDKEFTFENFDKIKMMDMININFEIKDELKEQIFKYINLKEIERMKFAIVCYLLDNGYIDNSKKNILKSIKIIGIKSKEKYESGVNNIIFIKLPKVDLEVELDLELVVKVFSKSEKLVFQYADVKKSEMKLQKLEEFNIATNSIGFQMPNNKSGNIFFSNFANYLNIINKSGILKDDMTIRSDITKIYYNNLSNKVIVNPINIEVIGNYDNTLSKALLKIYLYIYMQSLFLMIKNESKNKINNFVEFIGNLKNYNFNNVRMKMLKYINYFYYSRYKLKDKIKLNKKVTLIEKETYAFVEEIINDNYKFLFLSKLSEFIFLQILNIFYFNNIIDVEYIKSSELKKVLKLDEENEKEFIKNIINYFGEYKKMFGNEFENISFEIKR